MNTREPQRIAFFGSGAFGVPTLEALRGEHIISLIVTQPDRPAGRGGRVTPTPVGQWAATHAPEVPLLKCEDVNEPTNLNRVRDIPADAWVVIAFGQKLSERLLADRFAINLHASLLPRWRGAAPINAAVLAGDKETGNSVITLASRMDGGLVMGQTRRPIGPTDTAGDLHDTLAEDGPKLVLDVLARHADGESWGMTQDEAAVTRAPKLSRKDAGLDLAERAEDCRRRINGLSPWPGVQATLAGVPVKLLRAGVGRESSDRAAIGSLVDVQTGEFRCGVGTTIRLLEIQPAGKKPMTWEAFARGRRIDGDVTLETKEPPE